MANSNPHQARAAKRQRTGKKAGSAEDLRTVVWEAIGAAVDLIRDPSTNPDTRLRAVHAVTQATGSYLKIYEATEIDARLRTIEEAREREHEL